MKPKQFGPCGLYCGACAAPDCNGCQSDFIDENVKGCYFRKCSKDKNIIACCFCTDYPCYQLTEFMNDKWPHHWTMKPNLDFIKNNGIKEWLTSQKQEWSCTKCGAPIFWYKKECVCGNVIKSWELPA